MIAKMKSNLSVKETLHYNDREKSEIIFIKNLTGENVNDVERQMAARQKLFLGRAKNLTAHIIISPDIEDGKRQTRLDWKEIGESFLHKAGLSSYQSVAYLHKDKEHFHLHIVVNRIDPEGKIFRHKNELAMSQRLGDEIAIARGMKRAAEIRKERKLAREIGVAASPVVGIVAKIRKVITDSAIQAWNNGRFDQEKYFNNVKAHGLQVQLFFKKGSAEVCGYALGIKGEKLINASQIGSEFTLRKLAQENPASKASVKFPVTQLKERIEAIFNGILYGEKQFDSQLFLNQLRSVGYEIKEYYNKDTGKLRGYGIEISHRIVNSSEIGPELTLTNLRKRFEETTKPSKQERKNPKVEQEPVVHHSEKEEVSSELKRTIEIQLLAAELRDLTSGHRYQSHGDFIQAIEQKGYHVHLRYDRGILSGYTIHKGVDHYHDKEISEGRFCLDQLIKKEVFIKNDFEGIYGKGQFSPSRILINTKDSFTGANHEEMLKQDSTQAINSDFGDWKEINENVIEREEAKKIIAKKLTHYIDVFLKDKQSNNFEDYFKLLQADGFKVLTYINQDTGVLRGYGIEKNGFYFYSSEIGSEFTLKSIEDSMARFAPKKSHIARNKI